MDILLNDEVLTLEEVAQFLKIGDTTIYQLTRCGELPARKIGREWRYLKSEVLRWMKTRGESQEGVVQKHPELGEYKVENGQTYVALWLPMTLEEKAERVQQAVQKGVNVQAEVLKVLRSI